jgi:hypothetical protein
MAIDQAIEAVSSAVGSLAREARTDVMRFVARAVEDIPHAEHAFREALTATWSQERTTMPEDLRSFIIRYLELPQTRSDAVDLVQGSESIQVSQFAAALLSLWDARNDSPRTARAFQTFESFGRRFFNLELYGVVGALAEFDPRVHELRAEGAGTKSVRIKRPGVYWNERLRERVILRALVELPQEETRE